MNWWGKILGGAFGFMVGGPLGALLGAALGHNFDQGLRQPQTERARPGPGWGRQERAQTAFFTATFAVMGRVCKADGRVSADEIAMARQVMAQMNLDEAQTQVAIDLFQSGKADDFSLDEVLRQARREIGYQPNLIQMFIEIQLYAAYADGALHAAERDLLLHICEVFNVDRQDFDLLARAVGGEAHHRRGGRPGQERPMQTTDAYAILGIGSDATDAEVKKAYRRLMSQHHPDKLVSKGLPEEMIKTAEGRTHEARKAYERIKEARGF
ncbi:MAG: co-chaperone DjlA [Gammaproteobacteria bacterium]|nr:MAG: co-chaperone DjlA [Gammaproteobacteria bacterium]